MTNQFSICEKTFTPWRAIYSCIQIKDDTDLL